MKHYNFLNMSFVDFRKYFNQRYSLSFKGKFVGLGRLVDAGIYELFLNKLARCFNRKSYSRPIGDVICLTIRGCVIKLYNR